MANPNQKRVIVLSVVSGGLTVREAADRFGVTRQWIYILLARYREDGEKGLTARSRRPRNSPSATPDDVRALILQLRDTLTSAGLDAGAESIYSHLKRDRGTAPSVPTIWRILRAEGTVTPQPQKRPRSSYLRFEAAQPNETWQSDFTHWPLADGTDTEIISWLDDHSRYLLHCVAHPRITGKVVVQLHRHSQPTRPPHFHPDR